jgi:CHAD domain-containing protein
MLMADEATKLVAPHEAEVESTAEQSAPEPQRVPPAADPWLTVRRLALKQLDRFMSLEPKVLRGDDPDAIHDIRVASRRLQQVLDLLYPPPPAGEIRKLRRKIQRTRRSLGEVRNCDVQLAEVESRLASKRAAQREIWEAVRHYLRQRRADSFQRALRKLSKLNLAVFYVRLRELLGPNGTTPAPRHGHVQTVSVTELEPMVFYDRLKESLDRVWGGFESQVELSHRDRRGPVLHGVRIAAKRLRYLLEVVHEFDAPGSGETLAWLRGLQQHLGEWHDREVLEQMMIEMVARPEFLRARLEIAIGVEKLILQLRRRKSVFEERYLEMTRDSEEYRRVREWVTYLRSSPSAALKAA